MNPLTGCYFFHHYEDQYRWFYVSERIPPYGKQVLVWDNRRNETVNAILRQGEDNDYWEIRYGIRIIRLPFLDVERWTYHQTNLPLE